MIPAEHPDLQALRNKIEATIRNDIGGLYFHTGQTLLSASVLIDRWLLANLCPHDVEGAHENVVQYIQNLIYVCLQNWELMLEFGSVTF